MGSSGRPLSGLLLLGSLGESFLSPFIKSSGRLNNFPPLLGGIRLGWSWFGFLSPENSIESRSWGISPLLSGLLFLLGKNIESKSPGTPSLLPGLLSLFGRFPSNKGIEFLLFGLLPLLGPINPESKEARGSGLFPLSIIFLRLLSWSCSSESKLSPCGNWIIAPLPLPNGVFFISSIISGYLFRVSSSSTSWWDCSSEELE